MPRAMSSAVLAAITSPSFVPAVFFQGTFLSGPVYVWSGLGPIVWNDHTWQGIGSFGGVSAIDEGSTVEARGITVSLSGFDPIFLPAVMGEFALLQGMALYLGVFNAGELIVDPLVIFAGRLDQPNVTVTGDKATIAINCESVLLDMDVAVNRRYTADDQQRDWPGDLCFNFVNAIQEVNLYWGDAPTTTNVL
jgi:hypothetical protein